MKHPLPRLSALAALLAVVLAAVLIPSARSQVQATPILLPMGVASSGNSSMAWFHEPSTGRVVACQAGGPAGVQCVSAKLP